jgi:hypothetical protein
VLSDRLIDFKVGKALRPGLLDHFEDQPFELGRSLAFDAISSGLARVTAWRNECALDVVIH